MFIIYETHKGTDVLLAVGLTTREAVDSWIKEHPEHPHARVIHGKYSSGLRIGGTTEIGE